MHAGKRKFTTRQSILGNFLRTHKHISVNNSNRDISVSVNQISPKRHETGKMNPLPNGIEVKTINDFKSKYHYKR